MYVRVRFLGKHEAVIAVPSKLTKIEEFRRLIAEKFQVEKKLQRLFYGGKLLEDGFTFHDYGVKLNDVIQLMAQPTIKDDPESSKENKKPEEPNVYILKDDLDKMGQSKQEYKDAVSKLYAIGDLVDVKGRICGAWYEGVIERIVYNPSSGSSNSPEPKYIKIKEKNDQFNSETDTNLLYVVKFDNDEASIPAKLQEIRPRARTVLDVNDLTVEKIVMLNYNCEHPDETGLWYDFKITEIKKGRGNNMKLIGTLFLNEGAQLVDTIISLHDKIYAIEEVVPINQRTKEYQNMMQENPEKRSKALNCTACRDNEELDCSKCGCSICRGKADPDKIILCDECNSGFHMTCLVPPMTVLPDDDWYCPSCKRDPNEVVAPGAAAQAKKESTTRKDWGRGMACVGKTKTCPMPEDHFGPIPGVEVGMCWRFRIQVSETGVHRPPVAGIHGREKVGAFSLVLSGGYEDDLDNGVEVMYTGSGGRDLSGNKRVAEHSCDQTLTRENKALARNCAVDRITDDGGDAGDNWREGKPVRVVRSHKMLKHFPQYAPKEGYRYDGIYKVVKFYTEKGHAGFNVWKYLLRRDDPAPAPWEEGAPHYDIVHPEGYLEAEADRKSSKAASKENKRKVSKRREPSPGLSNGHTSTNDAAAPTKLDDSATEPPKKKFKKTNKKQIKNQITINELFSKKTTRRDSKKSEKPKNGEESAEKMKSSSQDSDEDHDNLKADASSASLTDGTASEKDDTLDSSPKKTKPQEAVTNSAQKEAIAADELNVKLWKQCYEYYGKQGKKEFVDGVAQVFICIICQDLVALPVTTPCHHNFCMMCLKRAFSVAGHSCPVCRSDLENFTPDLNEMLQRALRLVMPGYDVGRK